MLRRALTALLSLTAAGSLALAFTGPGVALAAPAPVRCDPPGLPVAIGNATDKQTADQLALAAANKLLADAKAALAALPTDATPEQIAAAQAAVDAAQATTDVITAQLAHDTDLIAHLTNVPVSISLHKHCTTQL